MTLARMNSGRIHFAILATFFASVTAPCRAEVGEGPAPGREIHLAQGMIAGEVTATSVILQTRLAAVAALLAGALTLLIAAFEWLTRLYRELDSRRDQNGRIGLTFEIIYGHAFKADSPVQVAAETQVSLEEMRRLMREARRPA